MLTEAQVQLIHDSLNKISTKKWFYVCVSNPLKSDRPHILATCKDMTDAYKIGQAIKKQDRFRNKNLFIEEWARYGKTVAEFLGKVWLV